MTNPTNSFWKWFALLLVVLNFTLLTFLMIKPGQRPHNRPEHMGPPPHGGPARFIIEQLHFTPEQVTAFDVLKKAHRDSIDVLQTQGRQLRHSYFEGLKTDSITNNTALAQQIANNQLSIERVTYLHFQEVKKLCTPQQKEIFNSIIQDLMQKMAPPPMGPKHHGGPPPPND